MGCAQLASVGAQRCDSFSSGVTERLSVLGLGLNSSPGPSSRKCVSFPARQSHGAGKQVCTSVEIHLSCWKNNPKFMTCWLQRCDRAGSSRIFVFHQTDPSGEIQMSVLSMLVATLGRETLLPLAEQPFHQPLGKAGPVTSQPQFIFIQKQHHPSLISEPVHQI